jgi:hypothetical protein
MTDTFETDHHSEPIAQYFNPYEVRVNYIGEPTLPSEKVPDGMYQIPFNYPEATADAIPGAFRAGIQFVQSFMRDNTPFESDSDSLPTPAKIQEILQINRNCSDLVRLPYEGMSQQVEFLRRGFAHDLGNALVKVGYIGILDKPLSDAQIKQAKQKVTEGWNEAQLAVECWLGIFDFLDGKTKQSISIERIARIFNDLIDKHDAQVLPAEWTRQVFVPNGPLVVIAANLTLNARRIADERKRSNAVRWSMGVVQQEAKPAYFVLRLYDYAGGMDASMYDMDTADISNFGRLRRGGSTREGGGTGFEIIRQFTQATGGYWEYGSWRMQPDSPVEGMCFSFYLPLEEQTELSYLLVPAIEQTVTEVR